MDDWAEPADDARDRRAGPLHRGDGGRPGDARRARRPAGGRRSPALVVGAGADDPATLGRARRAGRAAGLPGLAGVVRRPRRLPAGPPAVRRPPARRPRRGSARRSAATTSSWRSARRCSANTPTSRARWSNPAPGRAGHRRPAEDAHRGPVRARGGRRTGRGLRRPRRAGARPLRDASAPDRPAPPPRPPADGEPLRAAHVLAALAERIAGGRPSSSRRRRRAAPTCTALLPGPRPLGFLSAAMGGLGLRPAGRDRRPDGAARPARWSRSSATARRSTRSRPCGARRTTGRRAVRRAGQRPLRDHGPARRAARRRARRRGRRSRRSTSPAGRGPGLPGHRVEHPRRTADGARRGGADPGGTTEPLVLEVAVVPDTTFAP